MAFLHRMSPLALINDPNTAVGPLLCVDICLHRRQEIVVVPLPPLRLSGAEQCERRTQPAWLAHHLRHLIANRPAI